LAFGSQTRTEDRECRGSFGVANAAFPAYRPKCYSWVAGPMRKEQGVVHVMRRRRMTEVHVEQSHKYRKNSATPHSALIQKQLRQCITRMFNTRTTDITVLERAVMISTRSFSLGIECCRTVGRLRSKVARWSRNLHLLGYIAS
jgi:hypothetical protein